MGSVPYLVGRPLDLGLEDEPGIALTREVPARLVEGLRSGRLDVALVSSIELFRRPGYRWLEGLAVAADGFVASVQVFLRRPLEDVRTLALDPASRAAATLVRILLAQRGLAPELVELPAGADPRAAGTDAWLAIGDRALREALAPDAPPVFNPAAAWRDLTGLPFPFAVWIVRPGAEPGERAPAFARARARGAEALPELARRAAREWSLPEEATLRYLAGECLYEPGEALEPALFELRDRAARLGLCEPDLAPAPVPVGEPRVA